MPSRHVRAAAFLLLIVAAVVVTLAGPAARLFAPSAGPSAVSAAQAMMELLAQARFAVGDEDVDAPALFRFYEPRDSRLAWSGDADADAAAELALQALSRAQEHGLDLSRYHLEAIRKAQPKTGAREAAIHDLLLTDGILRYAHDLRIGRVSPPSAYTDVDLPRQTFDTVTALQSAIESASLARFLEELAPPHPEYERLKSALSAYQKIAADGGWSRLDRATDTQALRARLMQEDAAARDVEIIEAIRRYQRRNGLEADGKLGPKTLVALNILASERANQIAANMERWRWLPRRLEPRYVMINAADATLKLVANGQVVLESKVIVGARDKPTPIFRAVAAEVTVNPPWNIPASIARNEILPRLRRNPAYLASQHIVIVNGPADDPHGTRINWERISGGSFPYQLQQLPGSDNALGRLKLEMPNTFNVYLHDTPGRNAFARNERTLSHGCVRVEQILPLASIALSGDAMSAAAELADLINRGRTERLKLKEPLPVYVLYWTVLVDGEGNVGFRSDVYNRDVRLISAQQTATAGMPFFAGNCEQAAG